MGAGKSLDLLKVAFNYMERNQKVILFTSAVDKRYERGVIKSRTGLEQPAIPVTDEFDIVKYLRRCHTDLTACFLTRCSF
jgi:thymidine kinase